MPVPSKLLATHLYLAFVGVQRRYERPLAGVREQTKAERAMQHFQSRLEREGTQCVRYAYSSDDLLWPVRSDEELSRSNGPSPAALLASYVV